MSSINLFQDLPRDVQLEVFKYLGLESLGKVPLVCKEWKALASSDSLWKVLDLKELFPKLSIIDKSVWEKNIDFKKYGLSCEGEELVDWRKMIKELYQMFVSLPIEDDAGITLLTMPQGLSFESPEQDHKACFHVINTKFSKNICNATVQNTYRIAITNHVLKNSRNLSAVAHQQLVQKFGCTMPDFLQLSTLCVQTYINSLAEHPIRLYNDQPWTYTRCLTSDDQFYVVGGFGSLGLSMYNHFHQCGCYGVGAMRRFDPIDFASLDRSLCDY